MIDRLLQDDVRGTGGLGPTFCSTFTGQRFDISVPHADNIDIRDVAHHLSTINRYTGGAMFPMSVAQHSVNVSRAAEQRKASPNLVKACLLHDAPEAYLNDITRPQKNLIRKFSASCYADWCALTNLYDNIIHIKFGIEPLTAEDKAELAYCDSAVCCAESAVCMRDKGYDWGWGTVKPVPANLFAMQWFDARNLFIKEFEKLWQTKVPALYSL